LNKEGLCADSTPAEIWLIKRAETTWGNSKPGTSETRQMVHPIVRITNSLGDGKKNLPHSAKRLNYAGYGTLAQ